MVTYSAVMPAIGTAAAWRDAARRALSAKIPPDAIAWRQGGDDTGLFDGGPLPPMGPPALVSRRFMTMSNAALWHSDPERFALAYRVLWRLRTAPNLLSDKGDRDVVRLGRLEKAVHRCKHKMKAFVRFREIGEAAADRRSFAAWFEPTHHTVEPTADFFVKRFADMDWRIVTPDVTAVFVEGTLQFEPGQAKPALPDDASEALWVTYFRNIYNPARMKIAAMQSEMPRKYWKNMPEATIIPELIAQTPARLAAMAAAAPTRAPQRVAKVQAQVSSLTSSWAFDANDLPQAVQRCAACPLHQNATQAVPGVGPDAAHIMIVGEQPGDQEDLCGKPFVGPAGQVLNAALANVNLCRDDLYLTNAVKHFKFTPRGRQRLHQRPNTSEITACHPWLRAEISGVGPKIIVALGATAALSLTGNGRDIDGRSGRVEPGVTGHPVLIGPHPAHILRLQCLAEKARVTATLEAVLRLALDLSGV